MQVHREPAACMVLDDLGRRAAVAEVAGKVAPLPRQRHAVNPRVHGLEFGPVLATSTIRGAPIAGWPAQLWRWVRLASSALSLHSAIAG